MLISTLLLLLAAESPFRPAPPDAAPAAFRNKAAMSCSASSGNSVENLPFARGKSFCSLDQYLAHLKTQSAIDLPWWREVSPGVYEHVKRMPGATRETATRAELMKRFGFKG